MSYKEELANRAKNNALILEEIKDYLTKNPSIRFIQALWNLGIITRDNKFQIVDRFYEEPGVTLNLVRAYRNEG